MAKMSGRAVMIVLGFLALIGALTCLFWSHKSRPSASRLSILRQGSENGRPVVFFRVQVPDQRRIMIVGAERVIREKAEEAFQLDPFRSPPLQRVTSSFWSTSTPNPGFEPEKGRKEFGVLAPWNDPVWKLRVTLAIEPPSLTKRFRYLRSDWSIYRSRGSSFFVATWAAWNAFHSTGQEVLESDFITNAIFVP
jgi:hypothetical protein